MKRAFHHLSLMLLAAIAILAACTPAAQTTHTQEPGMQTSAPQENLPIAETENTKSEPVRFTLQADADLQDALTALYKACYPGEEPVFVAADADILATTAAQEGSSAPTDLPATFLPGSVLISQTDSQEASDFIAFAISTAGQQALIDLGALPASLTLTDQAGNIVTIPQPVERVISAYGPATAIIYSVDGESPFVAASYLGAKDPLGSTAMRNIDSRFDALKSDDYFSQSEFNLEEAASRNPDLIIANARSSWLNTVAELDIPLFLYDAETPEALQEAVLLTGDIFGPNSAAQAQAWVNYYESIVSTIQEGTQSLSDEERPRVLFTGTSPLRVVSSDMLQARIIEIAGGVSASVDLSGYWNDVNLEQIAAWDPDVILVPSYGGASVAAITEDPEWQIIRAVQTGRVYQMPKLVAPWDTPTSDSILGIIWLSQVLFPDRVDLDCREEAEFYFTNFYDYAISAEELDTICAVD